MAEGNAASGCRMPRLPTSLPGAAGLPGMHRRGSGQCHCHAEQQISGIFHFPSLFSKGRAEEPSPGIACSPEWQ